MGLRRADPPIEGEEREAVDGAHCWGNGLSCVVPKQKKSQEILKKGQGPLPVCFKLSADMAGFVLSQNLRIAPRSLDVPVDVLQIQSHALAIPTLLTKTMHSFASPAPRLSQVTLEVLQFRGNSVVGRPLPRSPHYKNKASIRGWPLNASHLLHAPIQLLLLFAAPLRWRGPFCHPPFFSLFRRLAPFAQVGYVGTVPSGSRTPSFVPLLVPLSLSSIISTSAHHHAAFQNRGRDRC